MGRRGKFIVLAAMLAMLSTSAPARAAETGLNADQLVELAVEVNPQIKAARARWDAARHQILQNYAPADPVFTYSNVDSRRGIGDAGLHSHQLTESFQFPGKALLQADNAKRSAEIARLSYAAAVRDLRAGVETGYYQVLLDEALGEVNAENIQSLKQVLQVTQVAYSANQVTQTDFISAEFDLAEAQQLQRQYQTSRANDEANLNQLLYRAPGNPLNLDRTIQLTPLKLPLDAMVEVASRVRQEILQTALAERNSNTALELAKLEYLPDYTVGYNFDYYLIQSFAPTPPATQAHTFSIGFNLPVFFWIKQREDVKSAAYDLEAARADANSIRSQTAASVTQLYRSAQLANETAQLYATSLIPLARQNFQVALTAYQSGKVDFVTLAQALQRSYGARVSYLQAANQFLAGRVALEQAIGAPLPK
jgi:outer membrane protein, heavy metal efflux system